MMFLFSFENYLRDQICCLMKMKIIIAFVAIFEYSQYSFILFYLILNKVLFDFTFSKSFIHGESLSSNVTTLFGVKFENMFNNISLKIDTCL